MAPLMPLPLTVCCFSKIQIGFTFLVPAYPGSPGKRAVKRLCVNAWMSDTCTGTDRRTDTQSFHRPCCAYYALSANNSVAVAVDACVDVRYIHWTSCELSTVTPGSVKTCFRTSPTEWRSLCSAMPALSGWCVEYILLLGIGITWYFDSEERSWWPVFTGSWDIRG